MPATIHHIRLAKALDQRVRNLDGQHLPADYKDGLAELREAAKLDFRKLIIAIIVGAVLLSSVAAVVRG